jgi:hypothetical protein
MHGIGAVAQHAAEGINALTCDVLDIIIPLVLPFFATQFLFAIKRRRLKGGRYGIHRC